MSTDPLTPKEVASCPACAWGWEATLSTSAYFCSVHAAKVEETPSEDEEVQS